MRFARIFLKPHTLLSYRLTDWPHPSNLWALVKQKHCFPGLSVVSFASQGGLL